MIHALELGVTSASPADALDIHALLVSAFESTYLKFSVYQSPAAAAFLARQIAGDVRGNETRCFVLRRGGLLLGFYQAAARRGRFFLSYIATNPATRQSGVGNVLLNHFEFTGAAMKCESLGLDVFRTNTGAVRWYDRRGYAIRTSRHLARFELVDFVMAKAPRLEVDSRILSQALAEEVRQGFSCVDCACAGLKVRLGLINGSICNLMHPVGEEAMRVAPSVARRFETSRRWLHLTGPSSFVGTPRPESQDEALYMAKTLTSVQLEGK